MDKKTCTQGYSLREHSFWCMFLFFILSRTSWSIDAIDFGTLGLLLWSRDAEPLPLGPLG